MSTPAPTQVQPAKPTKPEELEAFDAARTLDRGQFRRYLQALEAQSAIRRGEPPPSALGRLFKPAEHERKLVLFTLGIIVMLIIIAVFAIEMWGDGSTTISTTLVTVAGTGLGFIGGMVSEGKRSATRDDEQTDRTTTRATTTKERTTTITGKGAPTGVTAGEGVPGGPPSGTTDVAASLAEPEVPGGFIEAAAADTPAVAPSGEEALPPSDTQAS